MKQAILLIFVTFFLSVSAFAKDIVLLVPGFFNSFAPEYFSPDIIQTFQNKGFTVYLASHLNPIGTIEDNGTRLERNFADIEAKEKAAGTDRVTFNVVAHSAGGFYTLFVANKQKYDIKNILTVSTPFKGVEFVQEFLKNPLFFSVATSFACLEGMVQLTPPGVKKFLSTIRISPKTRVSAFGGFQKKNFDVWNAKYISTPLRVTSAFISEQSDGIVGFSSAMGVGEILTTDNRRALQYSDPNYFLSLEHWEQVLDSKSFIILGIRNTSYIRKEQIRFYSGLADYLHTIL